MVMGADGGSEIQRGLRPTLYREFLILVTVPGGPYMLKPTLQDATIPI